MMRERNQLAGQMEGVRKLEQDVADTLELLAMAEADGDAAMIEEGTTALRTLAEEAKRREIESLLAGEADANDAYIEINAGTGGTEAQDWAEMLMRMYMRWAEQHGYKVQLLEQSEGEQAGIKSATLQVGGANAYGWLKTEAGVHRWTPIARQARAGSMSTRRKARSASRICRVASSSRARPTAASTAIARWRWRC
jgi:peptide chain release factor 2